MVVMDLPGRASEPEKLKGRNSVVGDLLPADDVTLTAPQIVICPSQPMTPKKRRRGTWPGKGWLGAAALKVSGNGAKEIDIAVGSGEIGQTRTRSQAPVPKLRHEIL